MMKVIYVLIFLLLQSGLIYTQAVDSVLYKNLTSLKEGYNSMKVDYIFYIGKKTAQEKTTLQTIANFLLQHPDLKIEIQVHSDIRGTEIYNRKMSQRTAEEIKMDLVVLGIEENRLIPKGMGETYPLIDCKNLDCNEDQHRMNRRIELVSLSDF